MGVARNLAKEVMKEIGNKSREFYEFVLPPIDMSLDGDTLTLTVDMPGFDKKDINLSIHSNILSINAQKKVDEKAKDSMICNQRPNVIDKKIRLPIRVKEGEEKVDSAKYADGILTIKITTEKIGKDIPIE
jgi:HSP20 family molecular chaperone IbpA